MAKTLDVRLQEAAGNSLNQQESLELILKDELTVRNRRQIERRVRLPGSATRKRWRTSTAPQYVSQPAHRRMGQAAQ